MIKRPVVAPPAEAWEIERVFPDLNPSQISALQTFKVELLKFNHTINLISSRTESSFDDTHLKDSIIGGRIVLSMSRAREIYDIGSGNGLPGLVMAVLDPDRSVVLLEKDTRKAEFLKHCAARCELSNLQVMATRLEDLAENSVEGAVSRGFASVGKAIVLARKAFKLGGEYFHFKGDGWSREIAEIPSQVCQFWEPSKVSDYVIEGAGDKLCIVVTRKIA